MDARRARRPVLHAQLPAEQPDLNWWNPEVRDEFDRILRFWFDRGVAGFRIDVAHMIVKDADLRDNPPDHRDDHWFERLRGQRQTYNANRPEVHDVFRRWRAIADAYDPPRMLVGETHVFDVAALATFYGARRRAQPRVQLPADARAVRRGRAARRGRAHRGRPAAGRWPVWTARQPRRLPVPHAVGHNDPEKTRAAMMMLLTLHGSGSSTTATRSGCPTPTSRVERILDPVGGRTSSASTGVIRSARRCMERGARRGVHQRRRRAVAAVRRRRRRATCTTSGAIPIGAVAVPRSHRSARAVPDLRAGAYSTVSAPDGVWAWRRGDRGDRRAQPPRRPSSTRCCQRPAPHLDPASTRR